MPLNTHTLMGWFGLVTFILTGMAVGRRVGLGVWEGAYITMLLTLMLAAAAYRLGCRVKKG